MGDIKWIMMCVLLFWKTDSVLSKVERSVEDDFPEEYDPYIPISDFPLDRKRREIKDLLGYPVQVERDSEVYDPYRPNEPTIFGKLMFHKIKKVASVIDKKAKLFMKKFPMTNPFYEGEDLYSGGFYPWATPSTSYSYSQESQPSTTIHSSIKQPSSQTTTYSKRPGHSVHSKKVISKPVYDRQPKIVVKSHSTKYPEGSSFYSSSSPVQSSKVIQRPVEKTYVSSSVGSTTSSLPSVETSLPTSSSFVTEDVPMFDEVESVTNKDFGNSATEKTSKEQLLTNAEMAKEVKIKPSVLLDSDLDTLDDFKTTSETESIQNFGLPKVIDTVKGFGPALFPKNLGEVLRSRVKPAKFQKDMGSSMEEMIREVFRGSDQDNTEEIEESIPLPSDIKTTDSKRKMLKKILTDTNSKSHEKVEPKIFFPDSSQENQNEDAFDDDTNKDLNELMKSMKKIIDDKDGFIEVQDFENNLPFDDLSELKDENISTDESFIDEIVEPKIFLPTSSQVVEIEKSFNDFSNDEKKSKKKVITKIDTPLEERVEPKIFFPITSQENEIGESSDDAADKDLVDLMHDVDSLLTIAAEKSAPLNTVQEALHSVASDFEFFESSSSNMARHLQKSISDFEVVLEEMEKETFSEDELSIALKVIQEELEDYKADIKVFNPPSITHSANQNIGASNIKIIPLNESPKVSSSNSVNGQFFGKKEVLGGKFQPNTDNFGAQRPNHSGNAFQASHNSHDALKGLAGGQGVLAYVVKDKDNPNRQFLVPASAIDKLHSNYVQ